MSDQQPVLAEEMIENKPPVSTSLRTSSTTLSLDGQPPFVTTTDYVCTATKPIWALISLFTHIGKGILIKDPERIVSGRPRKIGPMSTIYADEWDDRALDLEESELVRLEPGQKFSTEYTIKVVPHNGLRGPDTYLMKGGKTYIIGLQRRRWRWMFEEELGVGLDEEKWREVLSKKDPMEWKVDCEVFITAV